MSGQCCVPQCPANTFCPGNCYQNWNIQAERLETKIPATAYDKARYIGTLNTRRQYKTDVNPAYGPMQGTLWSNKPPN